MTELMHGATAYELESQSPEPASGARMKLRLPDLFAILVPFFFAVALVLRGRHLPESSSAALALFGVALGGLLCRAWASVSPRRIAQVLGNFYCILTIWIAYSRLNPLIDALNPVPFDRELQALDHLIFGLEPSVWLERFHNPWFTEILYLCYVAFFFWQLALGILLYRRHNGDFDHYFLTVILFYMLSYIGYVLVPAIGPRFDIVQAYSVPLEGVWVGTQIRDSFYDIPMVRDCFPSGHTGLTLLVLFRAYGKRAYGFFAVMLPFALLLIFSTIYCRFHYLIDLVAAIPFIAGILCVERALRMLLPEGVTVPLRALDPRREAAERVWTA